MLMDQCMLLLRIIAEDVAFLGKFRVAPSRAIMSWLLFAPVTHKSPEGATYGLD